MINSKEIIDLIPNLETIKFKASNEIIKDNEVSLTWDGTWSSKTMQPVSKKSKMADIVLTSSVGDFVLNKPFWTSWGGGITDGTWTGHNIEGTCLSIQKGDANLPHGEKIFRCIIGMRNDELKNLLLPEGYEDTDSSSSICGVLPIDTDFGKVDCFYLKKPSWFVIELTSEKMTYEDFDNLSSSIRRFLTYLLGIRLDRKTANMVIDKSSMTAQLIRWYTGNDKDNAGFYRPIPSLRAEMYDASKFLNVPDKLTGDWLSSQNISACWRKFYSEPELVTCVEYLLHFPVTPVDMRGAILSVALESLADHLKKKIKYKTNKPLKKDCWKLVREKLFDLIEKSHRKRIIPKIIKILNDDLSKDFSEGLRIFKSRIEKLNDPTNRAKLTQPFEHFKIPLTQEDVDSIETRNKFLHEGRLIEMNGYRRDESWRGTYMIEMRLFTLINRLFLTYLGYKGPIINWGEMHIGQRRAIKCRTAQIATIKRHVEERRAIKIRTAYGCVEQIDILP